ncbi:prolyl-tRNA synthetase associated domain-containing protein [Terrarubrum flagellatum]|uniref:prolyl-tRNA synthetase associated domain-containing protein n=1 Tax=Terrirubrum flagellatum TaxID=2895980 RepID=UPI0031454D79
MPVSEAELFSFLDQLGVRTETEEHEAFFTVEQGRQLYGERPPGHTKNLFLKDKKGQLFLVTASQDARIDLKKLHEAIGASGRLSFGSAELLYETLGVTPGSVTCFAVLNDREGRVRMVLDATLAREAVIYGHPLRNTATTAIRRDDLLKFLKATGHDPLIVALPEPTAATIEAAAG